MVYFEIYAFLICCHVVLDLCKDQTKFQNGPIITTQDYRSLIIGLLDIIIIQTFLDQGKSLSKSDSIMGTK